ncbi:BLUF domain-containing protein [Sphingomonas parva]|uniref:BLUF domain-containing protein n=1 Tax=Sphingomonas parva TaxID=2555898 RepID=UPI00143043F9|nr:BLUF domain-containing protein [Sphingomonas parva]
MKSLLYASVSTLAADEEEAEIGRIVEVSRAQNARLGITGTLIFTKGRFAQIIEGPAEAVDHLMEKIVRDRRHARVTVVDVRKTGRRRFTGWSLSYSGVSHYIDKHIRPLFDEADPDGIRQLRQLMQALADTD